MGMAVNFLSSFNTETAELLVNMSLEEPSWWVWVTDDMVPSNFEERSGIDDENYLIISEEYVVDAVANFMTRCIVLQFKGSAINFLGIATLYSQCGLESRTRECRSS